MKLLQKFIGILILLIPLKGMAQSDPIIQLLFDQATPNNTGTETNIIFNDLGGFTYQQSDEQRAAFVNVVSSNQGITFKTLEGTNYPIANGNAARSFSFWIKPKVLTGTQSLIYTGAGSGTIFTLQLTNQGKIKLADNGGNWVAAQTILEVDQWAHVTVTLKEAIGIHDVEFYINGMPTTVGTSGTNNIINTNTGVFKIFGTLTADIADFRYYDKHLDFVEVFNVFGQKELLLDVVTNESVLSDRSSNDYAFSVLSGVPTIGFDDVDLGSVLSADGAVITASGFRGVEGVTPRTILFWYKQKEDAGTTDKLSYYGAENNKFDLQIRNNNSFRFYNFYSSEQGGSYLAVNEEIDFSVWRHIAIITNGETVDDVKIYIDGVEKDIDLTNATVTAINTTLAGDFRITNATQGYFNSYKVYKGALSEEEVKADFEEVKFNQTITFEALPTVDTRTESIELSATTSSGLEVTFESSNPDVGIVEGSTLTIVGAGETVIKASQLGNDRYKEAIEVTRELLVTQYIPEVDPLLDFSFSEENEATSFINTGVLSEVSLFANTSGGAGITLGAFDEDKGQVLGVSMEQGTGSLIFKENGGNYSGVTGTDARTYSAWIKPNDLSELNTIFYAGIEEGEKTSLSVQVLPTGTIKLVAGGNIVTTEAYHFIENQWNHIVVSIPNEAMLSDIQLYINGTLAETEVTNDRVLNTAPATFAIANKFWGLFSDFKYYERAISEEEAVDLYASTIFTHRINFNLPSTLAVRETVDFMISTSSNLEVEYSISDPTKIKIEEGKLTALEEGEVIIEATSFGVTSSHQLTITPYIPEQEPLLDFAFSENVYDPTFINTGVLSEVSLFANTSGGAGITLGAFDEDKGQVLGVSMEQGTGSLIFKENGGNYSGVTGTDARTYSAWIKPNDLSELNTIFYAGIEEGEKTPLSVQVLPTGAVKLVAGGNIITTEAYHFIENQWNHIVVSIPNEVMLSDIQMYINGTLAETEVTNDRVLNTAPATFAIANKFWGLFSDFKYYERAISEEEAIDLYASTIFTHRINFNLPSTLAVRETVDFMISTSSNLEVEYRISDPTKIKIEEGKLTALEEGEVIIEATSFGVTSSHQLTITPYIPEQEPLLDFAFSENVYDPTFINTGVLSEVSLSANTSGGAGITLGAFDEDKGQVLGVSMEQGTGSLIFKKNGGNYSGVTGTDARTYSAWIKPNDLSEFNTIFYAGIEEGEKTSLSVQVLPIGVIKLVAGGNIVTTEEYHFIENQWNHIVVSIPDEAMLSDIQLYINGTLAETIVTNDRLLNTAPATFAIANKFWGLFSDFKYYERAISEEEAIDLYASTVFMHRINFNLPSTLAVRETVDFMISTSSNLEVEYSISDPTKIKIEEGNLTALEEGEVIIEATSFGVTSSHQLTITPYIPEEEPLLDFAFSENVYDPTFINTGVLSEVSLFANESGGAEIALGVFDEDKGQVLGVSMEQGTGSLIFKENGGNYSGVTGTDARTYSVWIKPNDLSEFNTIFYAGIDEGEKTSLSVQVLPTGTIKLVAGGNIVTTEAYHFIENQWNHIVVSIPNEAMLSDIQLYINGTLAETEVTNDRVLNTAPATFAIANKFWGLFSDFKYYERAISEEEAINLYASTVFMHHIVFEMPSEINVGESIDINVSTSSNLPVDYSIDKEEVAFLLEGQLMGMMEGEVILTASSFGVVEEKVILVKEAIKEIAPAEEPILWFAFDEAQGENTFTNQGLLKEVSLEVEVEEVAIVQIGANDEERENVLFTDIPIQSGSLMFKEGDTNFPGVVGTAARTYSMWIKPTDLTEQKTLLYQGITIEEEEATNISLQVLPTGQVKFVAGGNITTSVYDQIQENQWNLLQVVIEENSTLEEVKIYINTDLATTTLSGNNNLINTGAATFSLANKYTGYYSDFRLYNRALDDEEIKFFIPKQEQWITFQPIEDKTYGEPEFRLEATSTSGLEVSFKSSDEGIIQIDGSIAKIVGYGKVSITATQWGDLNYNPAAPVSIHFIVDIGKYKEKPELQVNYRFDEPADLPGDPYDYSDYHRTAIMRGSYSKGYVDQERGEVMNFKVGTLEIEDYEGVLGSQKRSMTTWFKANETKQSILTSYGEAGAGQFNIVYRANNKIRVSLFYNSYEDADGSPVYESSYVETEKAFDFISEWHHVAVVTEGETLNDIKIYIDGKPENVIISPWEGFESVNTVKGANFKVALNADLKMSDYRWFTGALNAQEVIDIFEGNKSVEEEIVVEDRVMTGGFGTAFIEMSDFFTIENQGLIYNVTSSNINVVKAQVEGSILLLNEVGNGVSEITVEVYSNEYELLGTQKFKVTISGSSEESPSDTFTFRDLPEFFRKKRNKPLLSFSTVTTIDVVDFGAQADDDRNDFEAINEALKTAVAVASADNPVRVKFGKGTYDLLPENEEAVHLFNLSDLSHIILDGTGTKINILSPTVGFIALRNARNVVVQGFEVDYEILPFAQGKVITIADDHIEIEMDKGFPSLMEYFMKNATQSWGYIRNEEGLMKEGVDNLIKTDLNGWNALGNSIYSITMSSSQIDNFEIGDYFIQMARNNGKTITKTTECKDVTFLNMTIYASPAGAYSMSKNEEVNLINCRVLLKEGRVHSTNADVIHVVGSKVGPWVQGCVFEGYADDAVNMKHGRANILEVLSPIELKVNSQFEVGNHLVAFNPREGKVIERVTILSMNDNDDGTYNITLSNPINVQKTGIHQSADHLYNEDFATESFIFRDNIFRNARRYGMLIQSAFGVVENNSFEDLSTGGIVMENAVDWGEGFLAHDILIQQNIFANCGFDKTFIEDDYAATIKMLVMKLAKENCNENDEWCGTLPADCAAQGLKNIWLKQNTIHYNKVGILANCVEEGSIIDNQILHNEYDPTLKEGEKGEAMNILQSTFDFNEVLSIDNEFIHSDWEVTISKKGLQVQYKGAGLPIASLTLYDAMARQLLTANINQHQSTISTSTYKNQLYIIRIVDQKGNVFTRKLMYL